MKSSNRNTVRWCPIGTLTTSPFQWKRHEAGKMRMTCYKSQLSQPQLFQRSNDAVKLTLASEYCSRRRFKTETAGLESMKSNGRSEHEHRLWLILLLHSHRSKYMTRLSQATYLLHILTVTWHFCPNEIKNLNYFEIFCRCSFVNVLLLDFKRENRPRSPWRTGQTSSL